MNYQHHTYVNFVPRELKKNSPKPDLSHLPQDQEGFERMLDMLRPSIGQVEIRVTRVESDKRNVVFQIFLQGKLMEKKYADIPKTIRDEDVESEIECLMDEIAIEYKKKQRRLWPGCRGDIARHYDVALEYHFNRWFDKFANVKRRDGY